MLQGYNARTHSPHQRQDSHRRRRAHGLCGDHLGPPHDRALVLGLRRLCDVALHTPAPARVHEQHGPPDNTYHALYYLSITLTPSRTFLVAGSNSRGNFTVRAAGINFASELRVETLHLLGPPFVFVNRPKILSASVFETTAQANDAPIDGDIQFSDESAPENLFLELKSVINSLSPCTHMTPLSNRPRNASALGPGAASLGPVHRNEISRLRPSQPPPSHLKPQYSAAAFVDSASTVAQSPPVLPSRSLRSQEKASQGRVALARHTLVQVLSTPLTWPSLMSRLSVSRISSIESVESLGQPLSRSRSRPGPYRAPSRTQRFLRHRSRVPRRRCKSTGVRRGSQTYHRLLLVLL